MRASFKTITAGLCALAISGYAAGEVEPQFGDDSGEYTFDDECDDPRFIGAKMAEGNDWTNVGRDASDCRAAVAAGARLWYGITPLQPTVCETTDFGEDGDEAMDGYCDDPRFFNYTSGISLPEDRLNDATDCKRHCDLGMLYDFPVE